MSELEQLAIGRFEEGCLLFQGQHECFKDGRADCPQSADLVEFFLCD